MAHIAAIWTGSVWAATSGLIGSRLCAAGYGCGQIAPVTGSMQVTALLYADEVSAARAG